MAHEHDITLGLFRLEMPHGRLWRGGQVIGLRPRSRAMLRYLVEHPGRLVTKAELRQHVWAGIHVTDAVLRVSVREIRVALGDSAVAPRYLETVGRQGYRWLVGGDMELPPSLTVGPTVGRQGDVEALEGWFQQAVHCARQLVFVGGEAGVDKTTVVEVFLACLAAGSGVRMARGQCVEHTGTGEPYLPVLEALGQLSRGPRHQEVLAALRRYAPMWLVQLPWLLSETELERLQRQVQGATSARMLRELAEVLEMLTAETPLVLVLEDLHWSDRSTVEFLTYVAQRRAPAQLLVVGTYRPVETLIRAHPLRGIVQELCGREQAVERRLELLPAEDVAVYVAGRLGGPVAALLTAFIHARTEGHALFMVNILEHLVRQGLVVRRAGPWTLREGADAKVASLPEGLQQVLVRRIEDLPLEARQVLEVANVAGDAFAAAAVAAGLQCPVDEVEAQCDRLVAQHHFIDDRGVMVWPDGTRGGSYQFQHALYPQVLYEQGRILRGWALAMRGDAGVAQICQGRAATEDAGLKLFQSYFLAVLAEACGQAGQPEAGLMALTEASTLVAMTGERWWEAEVSRLQGALRLQLPVPDVHQADDCFQQALAVARVQQAKALELRAALSLSRLWQQQGKRDEARKLLAPVYGWFTEGFDTPDLQEAKALLAELQRPRLSRCFNNSRILH